MLAFLYIEEHPGVRPPKSAGIPIIPRERAERSWIHGIKPSSVVRSRLARWLAHHIPSRKSFSSL